MSVCLAENLYYFARSFGVHIENYKDVLKVLNSLIERLSQLEDYETKVSIEDLLAFEECLIESLNIPQKEEEKPLRFELLTPLAKLYYVEFRGVLPEEYNRNLELYSSENEELLFENFINSNLSRRLKAYQLKRYLEYVKEAIISYGLKRVEE